MQSQDIDGNVVQALMAHNEKQAIEAMREAEEKLGAVSHRIGHLPTQGLVVEIHGLKYKVTFVDALRGKLRLKLLGT